MYGPVLMHFSVADQENGVQGVQATPLPTPSFKYHMKMK